MQVFNGLTMGLTKNYRVFFDVGRQEKPEGTGNQKDILSLSENDISLLEDLKQQNLLDENFDLTRFQDQEGSQEGFNEIKISLLNILNGNKIGMGSSTYGSLCALAFRLGIENTDNKREIIEPTNLVSEAQAPTEGHEDDSLPEIPTISFNGDLTGIEAGEENEKQENSSGLYNGLKRNAPAENETLKDNENLYKTMEKIKTQLDTVSNLLNVNDDKLDKSTLNIIKTGLEQAQTVINYTTPDNVRILQKFISENLSGDEQTAFNRKSKRGENFDGKFGKGTLQGLNIILGKTDDYINNMKTYQEALNKKENEEKLGEITVKTNPTISKIDNTDNIDFNKLANELIKLPDGVSPEFELSNEDKQKLSKVGTRPISLTVKIGNESKVFDINVTVTENTNESENDSNTPTDTTPLKINDNLGNENTYLVMQNSQQLAGKIGITGVTFYSSNNFAGEQPSEGQNWPTARADTNTPSNSDHECLMKLSNNPDNIYKVKIDRNGNLCPTAQYFNSKRPVFFEYNTSCENYLRGKLPDVLKNNNRIKFGWNGKDYTIGLNGFDKNLTIEPMTIDGYRLGDGGKNNGATLEESLAFLNLTNYLRNQKDLNNGIEFKNDNPNLKLDDDKLKVRVNKKKNSTPKENGKYENQGKRYTIDKASFGITEREEILERFIKYNNGEHREDNWNRKNPNKEYKLIKIQ